MRKHECTTVIVGKKASIDGSVMISRNEDYHGPINPKAFTVTAPSNVSGRTYVSEETGLKYELPSWAFRHTAMPSRDSNEKGVYAEAGINEYNVAVSSTESLYGNERVLALDPLIKNGVAEDAINDVVLPFVKSAREGVHMLGNLIEKYGSAEGNGVLFADENEAFYMEIPTGHHWLAVRIPDDSYAVAPNHVCIENIDFDDPVNFIFSDGLKAFIDDNRLNPDLSGYNFRHIFGTYSALDRIYNCPRAWYAHKLLSGSDEYEPTSGDIPFIKKANRLLSVEDVSKVLSSHFNETVYDPIGNMGSDFEKKRFRSISLSRTSQGHILQIRSDLPERLKSIQWISMGTGAFNPFIPFFTYVSDTPAAYRDCSEEISLDNAYWLAKIFGYYCETNLAPFSRDIEAYIGKMQIFARKRVNEIIAECRGKTDCELLETLTRQNELTSNAYMEETVKQLKDFAVRALSNSKLSFQMDKNL